MFLFNAYLNLKLGWDDEDDDSIDDKGVSNMGLPKISTVRRRARDLGYGRTPRDLEFTPNVPRVSPLALLPLKMLNPFSLMLFLHREPGPNPPM